MGAAIGQGRGHQRAVAGLARAGQGRPRLAGGSPWLTKGRRAAGWSGHGARLRAGATKRSDGEEDTTEKE